MFPINSHQSLSFGLIFVQSLFSVPPFLVIILTSLRLCDLYKSWLAPSLRYCSLSLYIPLCHYLCLSLCRYLCLPLCHCLCLSLCRYLCLSLCRYLCLSLCRYLCMSVFFFHRQCMLSQTPISNANRKLPLTHS